MQVTLQACERGSTEETFQAEDTHHARPRRRATESCVGQFWTVSIWPRSSRDGSQCCNFAHSSSREGFVMHPVWRCKKERTQRPRRTFGERKCGNCSCCCRSCCWADPPECRELAKKNCVHGSNKFAAGQWGEHLVEGQQPQRSTPDSCERRSEAALQKVKLGEVSRAPRPLSEQVREFQPVVPVDVDRGVFLKCLKAAPRGASPGPGGCSSVRPVWHAPISLVKFPTH